MHLGPWGVLLLLRRVPMVPNRAVRLAGWWGKRRGVASSPLVPHARARGVSCGWRMVLAAATTWLWWIAPLMRRAPPPSY